MGDPLDKYFEVFESEATGQRYMKFPCQRADAGIGETCHVPIDVVKRERAWESANAAHVGPVLKPTISPSVKCVDSGCHFFLSCGEFKYCEDHKGRRVDG